jgi:hypothetical protein
MLKMIYPTNCTINSKTCCSSVLISFHSLEFLTALAEIPFREYYYHRVKRYLITQQMDKLNRRTYQL